MPVWHNGKTLRKECTTKSCTTVAAKVTALMILR